MSPKINRRSALKGAAAGTVLILFGGEESYRRLSAKDKKTKVAPTAFMNGVTAGHTNEMPGPAPKARPALLPMQPYNHGADYLTFANYVSTSNKELLLPFDGFTALELGTFEKRWSADFGKLTSLTPAIDDDVIYAGFQDIGLMAINSKSHKKRWLCPFPEGRTGMVENPIVKDGMVFVLVYFTEESQNSLPNEIWAVEASTGTLRWKHANYGNTLTIPVVSDSLVFLLYKRSDQQTVFVALDAANGEERWRLTSADAFEHHYGAGIVAAAGQVFAGRTAIEATTGIERWRNPVGKSVLAYANGVVFHHTGTAVMALDATTGEKRWTSQPFALIVDSDGVPVYDGVAVCDDMLFCYSLDGTAPNQYATLYAFDIATGTYIWALTLPEYPTGLPTIADGKIVVVAKHSHKLYLFG